MPESIFNIGAVCENHAPKPQEKYAKEKPKFFIGKFVKKGFEGVNPTTGVKALEHMWVRITSVCGVEKNTLHGTLNNDPLFDMDIKDGSKVTVKLSEIEDVCD